MNLSLVDNNMPKLYIANSYILTVLISAIWG